VSTRVAVEGASCRPVPSSGARATRLDGLRAEGPAALAALLAELAEPPPWDAAVAPDDPLASWLAGVGFEPYARTVVLAARADGVRAAPLPRGVSVAQYRNEWAPAFQAAEAAAMAEVAFFRETGQPSGFEQAEGYGAFAVARRGEEIVGFAQADLPDGWVNWIGVTPEERRTGIGRALAGEVADAVRRARGTHVVAEVEEGTSGLAFWTALGLRRRGESMYLIRRA